MQVEWPQVLPKLYSEDGREVVTEQSDSSDPLTVSAVWCNREALGMNITQMGSQESSSRRQVTSCTTELYELN